MSRDGNKRQKTSHDENQSRFNWFWNYPITPSKQATLGALKVTGSFLYPPAAPVLLSSAVNDLIGAASNYNNESSTTIGGQVKDTMVGVTTQGILNKMQYLKHGTLTASQYVMNRFTANVASDLGGKLAKSAIEMDTSAITDNFKWENKEKTAKKIMSVAFRGIVGTQTDAVTDLARIDGSALYKTLAKSYESYMKGVASDRSKAWENEEEVKGKIRKLLKEQLEYNQEYRDLSLRQQSELLTEKTNEIYNKTLEDRVNENGFLNIIAGALQGATQHIIDQLEEQRKQDELKQRILENDLQDIVYKLRKQQKKERLYQRRKQQAPDAREAFLKSRGLREHGSEHLSHNKPEHRNDHDKEDERRRNTDNNNSTTEPVEENTPILKRTGVKRKQHPTDSNNDVSNDNAQNGDVNSEKANNEPNREPDKAVEKLFNPNYG